MRDDDVVEKAGDGLARVSIALALSLERAIYHTAHSLEKHRDTCGCRVRDVVRRGLEASKKAFSIFYMILGFAFLA